MFRFISPMVLPGLIILSSISSPLLAQAPPLAEDYPGAALFQRGWKYDQGLGVPINMPEAIRLYQDAATLGHPLAKARLARIYFSGNGIGENKEKAERLAKGTFPGVLKAAKKNDPVAQLIVSSLYEDGLGIPRDSAKALKWLRKAADQNLALAQANLGVTYENGLGVARNIAEAAKWFRKAADQNSAMAQAYLGDLYDKGRGVPRDEFEAERLYRLAAEQNFAHAQTNLGYMYEHGCVVEWNPCEAVRLYRLAAEQGFAVAEANLGVMYEKGCGVTQDLDEAVRWYLRAAAQGDENAIKALRCLGYEQ